MRIQRLASDVTHDPQWLLKCEHTNQECNDTLFRYNPAFVMMNRSPGYRESTPKMDEVKGVTIKVPRVCDFAQDNVHHDYYVTLTLAEVSHVLQTIKRVAVKSPASEEAQILTDFWRDLAQFMVISDPQTTDDEVA